MFLHENCINCLSLRNKEIQIDLALENFED